MKLGFCTWVLRVGMALRRVKAEVRWRDEQLVGSDVPLKHLNQLLEN